jgi:MFS family permease
MWATCYCRITVTVSTLRAKVLCRGYTHGLGVEPEEMADMKDKELETLEREVFRKFHEDGLFDIYLGALLGIMGAAGWLTEVFDSPAWGMTLYASLVLLVMGAFALARRRIVKPRLGTFKPSAPRKRKITMVRLVLLGSVIVGLLLFWAFAEANSGVDTLRAFMPAIWFANAMVVFGAIGYYLDVPRFYLYGVLFGLPLAVDTALTRYADVSLPPAALFGVAGLITIAVGAYKFAGFLRDYPVRADEVRPYDT